MPASKLTPAMLSMLGLMGSAMGCSTQVSDPEPQPADLEDVVVGLDVHETQVGELGLTIDGTAPGELWNWSDFAELADLTLGLTGTTAEIDDAGELR